MFTRGITQYLTTIQGMPKEIETRLQKMISTLVWDGNKASVDLDTMNTPPEEGGINLLDIKARNEAIQIMWLKKYTSTGPDRPMWALVADVLIEENIAKSRNIDKEVTMNTYLQTWSPTTNMASTLPPDIKKMLNTGNKYNLCLDALRIPESIKRQLPTWYHLRAKNNPIGFNHAQAPKCLKSKHQIITVGDLIRMTNWIREANPLNIHQDLNTCQCNSCTYTTVH
jgi:hypothetical protein